MALYLRTNQFCDAVYDKISIGLLYSIIVFSFIPIAVYISIHYRKIHINKIAGCLFLIFLNILIFPLSFTIPFYALIVFALQDGFVLCLFTAPLINKPYLRHVSIVLVHHVFVAMLIFLTHVMEYECPHFKALLLINTGRTILRAISITAYFNNKKQDVFIIKVLVVIWLCLVEISYITLLALMIPNITFVISIVFVLIDHKLFWVNFNSILKVFCSKEVNDIEAQ